MPTVTCKNCGQERRHAAKGLCRTCYNRLQRPEQKPRKCTRCREKRVIRGHGLCGRCYSRQADPTRDYVRPDDTPLAEIVTRQGLTLATLHDAHAAEEERARRVEIYTKQVEENGCIDWGALPRLLQ